MSKVDIDIKELLKAGAHFGHSTSRWHPKMAEYIHSKRGGSHIIDLTKTVELMEVALASISKTVAGGGQILLVSTKKQAQDKILSVATETKMPYVINRWLGGMLTNSSTMNVRIKHLKDLEARMDSGELAVKFNKLEVQRFAEEIEMMNHLYGGIKEMHKRPAILFVLDVNIDKNAVNEAIKLGIPVVGIVDTNSDPSRITLPIPCNDDAIKTIDLVLDYVKQAVEIGKNSQKAKAEKE